ncbi:MAG: MerR family transcriptional regulator [Gammaproteobacteria bacterium]|nr:MerR family transcriptional regulator [Gammaproteobacteria bacterium]
MKCSTGIIVEDHEYLSLVKICRYCCLPAESIITMVERGMIEPINSSVSYSLWQFPASSLIRIKTALRLQRDLEVNLAGAALALELLDEIKQLRRQLANLQARGNSN